jgi:4-aminobutyrate aminotransferase/(S)-3-amino-2-methylpropionate transaminase
MAGHVDSSLRPRIDAQQGDSQADAFVLPILCGSSANENAFKLAMMHKARKRRGGHDNWSPEELQSCMINEEPGSPDLKIMSFKKAFHGRTMGALSCTRTKEMHKLDIAAFDWPTTDFPTLTYPLNENVEANALEEQRCLDGLEKGLKAGNGLCAAVIVEPIQAEGGDNHASADFFKGVQRICAENGE